jgi:hypothetical protein
LQYYHVYNTILSTEDLQTAFVPILAMRKMLPALVKTLLLYVAALVAYYCSDRLNPHASDAGIGQSLLVVGVVAAVLLSALLYALYKAIARSPHWWAVVILHLALAGALFAWLMR